MPWPGRRTRSTSTGASPRPTKVDAPVKHSLTLGGHRTSVSLEPAFWTAFREIAAARGLSVNALAARIDAARAPSVGLATAIRLEVLAHYRASARADVQPDAGA